MNVSPFKTFFEQFKNRKMPGPVAFEEFLTRDAEVPAEKAEEAMGYITSDAEAAGLVRTVQGGIWIDLEGTPAPPFAADHYLRSQRSHISGEEAAAPPESPEDAHEEPAREVRRCGQRRCSSLTARIGRRSTN